MSPIIIPDQSSSEPIYHASRVCLALFDEHLADMSLSEQSLALVGELRGEFKTWAAYIGAFAVPRASLDARLVSHSDIRDMVLDLLMVLEQNLKWARKTQPEGGEQVEEEADVSLGLPVVRSAIERLFILAVSIRRSARQTASMSHKPHSSGNADSSCLLLLQTRYPNARKSLLDQLVQSVHARGESLQYLRSHNRKLAHEREPSTHSCEEDPMEEDVGPLGDDLVPTKHIERGANTELQTDPSSFSPSTVVRQHNRTMPNVRPSRSLVSTGSTVKEMVGDELPYPPMPKPENLTGRVICTICSEPMDVFLLTEERWKAHVDADLHPYVCISEQCKEPLKFFQQKQDWVEHMQTRHTLEWAQRIHTEVWQCDIGHLEAKYFDQKDHYLGHLKKQHDGQFTPSQIQGRARRNKKTATREPFVCPLCDCIPDDIEHIVHDKPYSKLTTHIRRHLKYISFFSLSYLGVDFGDSGSITGSSNDDNDNGASRSSHSLNRIKDVSLSDIPETEIIGQSRMVQGEVFPDVPLDADDSDWSFIPQATLETNWDMLQKGFESKHPVPEHLLHGEHPFEALEKLELQNKQPRNPSLQVPISDMMPGGMSSFHRPIPSKFVAISIDFGTVCSRVSYTLPRSGGWMYNIINYPGLQSSHGDATQVPTVLDLKTGSWGYQVKPYMEMPIKWLKLLLLREDEIQYDEIRNWRIRESLRLQELGLTAVSVVSMFLRKIWSHTLDLLKERSPVRSLPLKVAITVPAIWPLYAKRAMRQAAQTAGILDKRNAGETILTLVEEPEAAALHFLRDMHPARIKKGDAFVVCNAGGSSIDVVTYLVESTEPFRVKECVMGSGKFAGGILIDEKFFQHLSTTKKVKLQKLGSDELWALETRWETTHKRALGAREDQFSFSYSAPAKAFSTWERLRGKTSFSISQEETTTFFCETLVSIQTLINEQLGGVHRPKCVFLSGGLGGSRYIFDTLRDSHAAIVKTTSEWRSSAVARGALARLLLDELYEQVSIGSKHQYSLNEFPEVTARKSRYSYGVAVKRNILALRDYDHKQDIVEIDSGGKRVTTRLSWGLLIGEEVERRSPVYLNDITYTVDQVPERLSFDIVYSASGTVHNRHSPEVKHLGRVECIWDKPLEELRRYTLMGYDRVILTMLFDDEQPKLQWNWALPDQSI